MSRNKERKILVEITAQEEQWNQGRTNVHQLKMCREEKRKLEREYRGLCDAALGVQIFQCGDN